MYSAIDYVASRGIQYDLQPNAQLVAMFSVMLIMADTTVRMIRHIHFIPLHGHMRCKQQHSGKLHWWKLCSHCMRVSMPPQDATHARQTLGRRTTSFAMGAILAWWNLKSTS